MGAVTMKQLLVYDLSRLIARRNAETPTGIDRVDLRYAVEILNSNNADVAYVRQHGNQMILLDFASSKEFLAIISRRWNHGNKNEVPTPPIDAK
jgi:hypothetical protein